MLECHRYLFSELCRDCLSVWLADGQVLIQPSLPPASALQDRRRMTKTTSRRSLAETKSAGVWRNFDEPVGLTKARRWQRVLPPDVASPACTLANRGHVQQAARQIPSPILATGTPSTNAEFPQPDRP